MPENNQLQSGDRAPLFTLPDSDENPLSLKEFKGRWVVLYFYPKDSTSGCTNEALDFSSLLPEFEKLNALVVGVSPDSPASHRKFISKENLKVTLLSDTDKKVLEKYGVWQIKKMYGREYYGVMRSTFLISPEGIIMRVWNSVKVKGHAEEVKDALHELQHEQAGT